MFVHGVYTDTVRCLGDTTIPLLGIDIGTGGSRALLLSEDGRVLHAATAEHAGFRSPQAAWAEQDPADWWRAAQAAIRQVLKVSGVGGDQIAALGLSGQMHGTVVLDERGTVLRPAIIWCDQRGEVEAGELERTLGASRLLELTSNPALTNFTLVKLLWLKNHEPETWRRIRHLLLPKDYVRYCLSGEYAIDVAEASGTLLLDVAHRRWSAPMIAAAGLDAKVLPALFESPEVCARVSAEAAALTGLKAGTPIVAGAGDQAAGAVGMGISRPGAVSATIGTSGVVFAATARPTLDPHGRLHTFCHAIPDRWHVMGVTQAAGLSLRWWRELLGGDYDQLTAAAATAPPGAEGVLWAPYLMGERTPHCDPNVRAGLVGLAAHHTRAHVARAVLEGVAFSLRDTFTIFAELGVPVERVRAGGGGARSELWRQIQADVYGHAIETVAAEEGAALGAALLAGVGAGVWRDVDAACDAAVHTAATVACRPEVARHMDARYSAYRRLYPALRELTLNQSNHAPPGPGDLGPRAAVQSAPI
ncbi:MAG TPA: xylulokinase [Terriglobales bacterium]